MTIKPRKKIMRKFRVDEISPVDVPAQAGALALLMKRGAPTEELAKAAFLDALTAVNVERDIFEDLWKFNDALRESIKTIFEDSDKYPDPVAAVKESLAEFASAVSTMIEGTIKVGDEVTKSGDTFPASDYAYVPDPADQSTWRLRITSEPGGAPDPIIVGAAVAVLKRSFQEFDVSGEDRLEIIDRVSKAWLEVNPDKNEDDLPEVLKEEPKMKKNEVTPTPEGLQKSLDEAVARAEKAELMATLTDVQKAHFNTLDDAGKNGFLKMDSDARNAEIEKNIVEDPVIYKSADGEEFRKSDDPRLVRMAKQADEDRKIAKAEREQRQQMELTKRAETDLSNLPGDADVKVAVLKAIDGISDETIRGKANEMLKAQDMALAKAFEKAGTTEGLDASSPAGRLEAMAKKMAADESITLEKAYDKVLTTDEGKALYEQTL